MDDETAETLTHQLNKLIQYLTAIRRIAQLAESKK